jgi:hypothetical protein
MSEKVGAFLAVLFVFLSVISVLAFWGLVGWGLIELILWIGRN